MTERRWLGIAAAAAAVLLCSTGCGSDGAWFSYAVAPTPAAQMGGGWWATWHDVTVRVPANWTWDAPPIRPDCIRVGEESTWSKDVPDHPYVAVDTSHQPVPAIGCTPEESDVPAEFGPLPFHYWQPYVAFADPHDAGAEPDGTSTYQGWTLMRRTVGDVQVAVLVRPGAAPARILDTARVLRLDEEDADGCPPTSGAQSVGFARPPGPSERPESGATSLSICQYTRTAGERAGLIGSLRLTGSAMSGLLNAIAAAPSGGGPDNPDDCVHDAYGDTALLLRAHLSTGDHGDAYVYYDWCFGNGVVTPGGTKQLTTADCRPLFAAYPVRLWTASEAVYGRCVGD